MALGPDNFNLTIALDDIFCFQGDDIDDILDEASEPYLWTFMVKVDGEGFIQQGNSLVGSPIYFFGPGSHGNLGGSLTRGTRQIPESLGRWSTSLKPIPISLPASLGGQQLTAIPGTIMCAAVLMEENLTPDSAVEAAHTSVQNLIVGTVSGAISSIGLAGVAADAEAEAVIDASHGKTTSMATAAQLVIQRRLRPIQDLFAVAAPANAVVTILGNLGIDGFIGSAIDSDKPMGAFARIFSQQELAATTEMVWYWGRGTPINLSATMSNMPEWAYNIGGRAYAHHSFVRRDPPGAKRLQVSCSTKRTTKKGEKRIVGIGGHDDGNVWWMTRKDAADAILKGERSFFVLGPEGHSVEVGAVRAGSFQDQSWPDFVQTAPDQDGRNNLISLPDCDQADTVEIWY
ncbi:hypothetical protein AB0C07_16845 [Actinoplanes missouriensis]|uniref:hypothetical protein n=1 Tax=Actinoplanes missouriensis TaxID=1866 RepID=UPI0033DB3DDA